jgi:hypothetical protein
MHLPSEVLVSSNVGLFLGWEKFFYLNLNAELASLLAKVSSFYLLLK